MRFRLEIKEGMVRDPEDYRSVEMASGIQLFTVSRLTGAGGSPVQRPESGFRANQRQYLVLQCLVKLELSTSGHHGDQDDERVQNSPSVATKHRPSLLLRGSAGCRWDMTEGWTLGTLLSSSPLLGALDGPIRLWLLVFSLAGPHFNWDVRLWDV